MLPVKLFEVAGQMRDPVFLVRNSEFHAGKCRPGRQYNFWGTIAVTEVRDFEAPLLVQSHASHRGCPYWPR